MPGRPERIHVHFHPDGGPVHMPLGTRVRLGIAQPGMANALRDEARLVRVDRRREDALECVFELSHPDRLGEVRGAVIDQRPDHRRHLRAVPGPKSAVVIPVVLPEAPPSAQRLMGRMIDGGAGGVGLSFPMVCEPLLARNTTIRASVPLPGHKGTSTWVCDVRYRAMLEGGRVCYGLMFMSDGLAVDPPGPQLEALWTCAHCHTAGLLDETHAFCPGCGAPSAGPRHHPSWQELATAEVHPFCGTDVACTGCGVPHSEMARYCGHCGTTLPHVPCEELPTVVDG